MRGLSLRGSGYASNAPRTKEVAKDVNCFISHGDYCGSGSLSQNGHEGMYLYEHPLGLNSLKFKSMTDKSIVLLLVMAIETVKVPKCRSTLDHSHLAEELYYSSNSNSGLLQSFEHLMACSMLSYLYRNDPVHV